MHLAGVDELRLEGGEDRRCRSARSAGRRPRRIRSPSPWPWALPRLMSSAVDRRRLGRRRPGRRPCAAIRMKPGERRMAFLAAAGTDKRSLARRSRRRRPRLGRPVRRLRRARPVGRRRGRRAAWPAAAMAASASQCRPAVSVLPLITKVGVRVDPVVVRRSARPGRSGRRSPLRRRCRRRTAVASGRPTARP